MTATMGIVVVAASPLAASSEDERDRPRDQVGRHCRQAVELSVSPAVFQGDIASLAKTSLGQPFANRCECRLPGVGRDTKQTSDQRRCRLLTPRSEWPRSRTAANASDEIAPSHRLPHARGRRRLPHSSRAVVHHSKSPGWNVGMGHFDQCCLRVCRLAPMAPFLLRDAEIFFRNMQVSILGSGPRTDIFQTCPKASRSAGSPARRGRRGCRCLRETARCRRTPTRR
jgi:hypothetical protein